MKFRSLFAVAALAATMAIPAQAQTYSFDPSVPYDSEEGLTDFRTDFNTVGGMEVEWTFVGGGGGSGTWSNLGGGVWGVTESGFSLTGLGGDDTFRDPWRLTGENIQSFTVFGAPGLGVFDIILNPFVTPGSNQGKRYQYECTGADAGCDLDAFDYWNTQIEYSNPVGIQGNPPLGDLWATMNVYFGTGFNAGNDNCSDAGQDCDYVRFIQDMDNAPSGRIGIPGEVVPEPATMTLLATGLAGMAAARRRKNAK